MYPPYWLSSKEGTYQTPPFILFIFRSAPAFAIKYDKNNKQQYGVDF